jgi:hypothetical protein
VCLDTGNFPRDGYAQSALCIPHAVNVHLKASIRTPDGTNEPADWDRLGGMFAAAGYRGYLSLEYEDREETATAVPRLAGELRRVARKFSV